LAENDQVVSLIIPQAGAEILTVTENGFGKRTALDEYPTKSRATKGVVSIKVSERNGDVVSAIQVCEGDELMMITNAGTLVRTRAEEVSQVGRNTQGVRLIRVSDDEKVVGLQRIEEPDEEEMEALANEAAATHKSEDVDTSDEDVSPTVNDDQDDAPASDEDSNT
jgi:DNA gyrase subunit A